MRVVLNGYGIIGIEKEVLKAVVSAMCDRCLHTSLAHTESGCQISECICKKGYTSYLLLQDEDFRQDIIREGLF